MNKTSERLKAIKARAEAATGEQWYWHEFSESGGGCPLDVDGGFDPDTIIHLESTSGDECGLKVLSLGDVRPGWEDADFISEALTDVKFLLNHIAELEQRAGSAHQFLSAIAQWTSDPRVRDKAQRWLGMRP